MTHSCQIIELRLERKIILTLCALSEGWLLNWSRVFEGHTWVSFRIVPFRVVFFSQNTGHYQPESGLGVAVFDVT